MQVQHLIDTALDWAVNQIEECSDDPCTPRFSTDWALGGPIIEREWIDLHCVNDSLWEAEINANDYHNRQNGPTPLIAAMRCFVYSHLGDEVEIPAGLVA